ncbi:MAG: peptide MFS transporter [Chitinophagaceae bacterium]|jgi:POT family proton-dependent oligopeptide transporter|nr:peptide MFS transporter [Chitinophagaceae bacterium]MBP6046646.1 peptide MFS transporter [Ferruginibacter sp.]MBK8774221.1 peptide MFS transporter [Chitinophagaceae bacterium]MBK8929945.1 peptide MFS transporter [Chitinophagaceae bacterium]MBP6987280.1 peptide MFS transporter [Ferruginibacter sp.]
MADQVKTGKHPKALYILFLTEMWERFAYYLMVGILLLYMTDSVTGGKGFSGRVGADIVGSFIALVYLTPFIGGLIADRVLGYTKSIFLGGFLMAAGYIGLSFPGDTAMFISLGLIIVGNGFFKPNISTLLGNIYNREDLKPLKDNAYNIFYMGINIGAFVCNFVAAYLRNNYGWGWAFAAAGIGLLIGLVVLALNLKHVKEGDVKKPVEKEDMSLGQIFGYVFLPAIIAAIIGWFIPNMIFGTTIMGTKANDAFIFACLPIIAFYISLWAKATGQDKKAIGSLLFIFAIAIAFWTIYNQNSTSLTLWAEKHTNRVSTSGEGGTLAKMFPRQTVSDTLRMVTKVNEHLVEVKDASPVTKIETLVSYNNEAKRFDTTVYGITANGNTIDTASKLVKVMGPDPYFNNVPKDQWPGGKSIKLTNTELFQSINPLFIVLLTLFFVPFFDYLRRRGKEPTTASKFAMAMFLSGLSALVMVFAIMSVPSIYTHKTSAVWLWGTYFVFTISEIFLSPIGLSFVSKLAPARLTALMMGGWFLSTSIGGKIAGVMTGFWDDFTDKKIFFLILVVAAFIGGILIFTRLKSLNQIVRDRTGSA